MVRLWPVSGACGGGQVREFNKMEAENKAKADAALEKKKLAEEARARKKAREAGAREVHANDTTTLTHTVLPFPLTTSLHSHFLTARVQASIAQNTAACEEVSKQIEDMQEVSICIY